MEFVLGLPKTARKHESIFVVVDKFSKMAHFILCSRSTDDSHMAKLLFKEIIRLDSLPTMIASDRIVKLVSYLWKILWKLFGTTLKYSSAFYPQTDGQIKVVNHSFSDLRFLVGEKPEIRTLILPHTEFAYNNSFSRSTGQSPFGVVHGSFPRQPIYLLLFPMVYCPSNYAQAFAEHSHNLYAEIRRKIILNNDTYKHVGAYHKLREFNEEDYVIVHICPEHYPKHVVKKLHDRTIGLYLFFVGLLSNMSISPVFNVKDLFLYRGTFKL